MPDFETNVGAEVLEPADPTIDSEDVGAEEQEVAEPVVDNAEAEHQKTNSDSAFAEMRRELEALRNSNAEYERALSNFFPEAEDKALAAEAFYQNRDYDELVAEREEANVIDGLKSENEQLRQAVLEHEAEKLMVDGLKEVQAIDPTVKSLEDLGESFASYIASGLTTKQAFFACKAEKQATTIAPAKPTGKVESTASAPKEFFTQEEVEAMTKEEVKQNYETIRKSMTRW
jgi:hypothetical protein